MSKVPDSFDMWGIMMNEIIGSFISNDSRFGQLMTRCGVIIGANLMFVLFSMPVFTIGASYTALHFVMLKTLRGDGQVNPFKLFWKGFKMNFRQATLIFLAAAAFYAFLYADFRLIQASGSTLEMLRYPLIALGIIAAALLLYLVPVMAAFEDTLPHLIRNALFFATEKIWKVPVVLFFNIFPLYSKVGNNRALMLGRKKLYISRSFSFSNILNLQLSFSNNLKIYLSYLDSSII